MKRMLDKNKILNTKVGDDIHFYINGEEGRGIVVKMNNEYVMVAKEDGDFQDIHINDTFFVKDILINKTWDLMDDSDRYQALMKIHAPSPRFIGKPWADLPQEIKKLLTEDKSYEGRGDIDPDVDVDADTHGGLDTDEESETHGEYKKKPAPRSYLANRPTKKNNGIEESHKEEDDMDSDWRGEKETREKAEDVEKDAPTGTTADEVKQPSNLPRKDKPDSGYERTSEISRGSQSSSHQSLSTRQVDNKKVPKTGNAPRIKAFYEEWLEEKSEQFRKIYGGKKKSEDFKKLKPVYEGDAKEKGFGGTERHIREGSTTGGETGEKKHRGETQTQGAGKKVQGEKFARGTEGSTHQEPMKFRSIQSQPHADVGTNAGVGAGTGLPASDVKRLEASLGSRARAQSRAYAKRQSKKKFYELWLEEIKGFGGTERKQIERPKNPAAEHGNDTANKDPYGGESDVGFNPKQPAVKQPKQRTIAGKSDVEHGKYGGISTDTAYDIPKNTGYEERPHISLEEAGRLPRTTFNESGSELTVPKGGKKETGTFKAPPAIQKKLDTIKEMMGITDNGATNVVYGGSDNKYATALQNSTTKGRADNQVEDRE